MSIFNNLSKDDFIKAKSIFIEAVKLPTVEIDPYINEETQGNSELKEAVISLLEMHEKSHDFTLNIEQSLSSLMNEKRIEIGKKLGKYTIEKRIGSGGMGDVFLAYRKDQEVHQKVAIKILKNKLNQSAFERFQIEKRILAHLDHPGIARLIDAGIEDGYTFYAMEYIEGQPIDEYCANQCLSIKERLRLFIQVCKVVSYAHTNLIIHRDLKPSNVLITDNEEVKLVDFGIAKPLELLPGIIELPETLDGIFALTPQYAAPEQFKVGVINTSCDVYTLGLLLYELLTTKQAQNLTGLSLLEIQQVITEEIPTSPSKRIASNDIDVSHFKLRHSNQLATTLNGDLDSIVNHALKKEPQKRYKSVAKLSQDIEHHLRFEPISVRNNQLRYKIYKYIRRNWMVLSTSLFLVAILAVSTYLISKERDRAIEGRQLAEYFSDIMIQSFKNADPTQVLASDLKASLVLDETSRIIKADGSSTVDSKFLIPIMQVYNNMSNYQQVIDLFDSVKTDEFLQQTNEIQAQLVTEKALAMNALKEQNEALEFLNSYNHSAAIKNSKEVKYARAIVHRSLYEYNKAESLMAEVMKMTEKQSSRYYHICAELGDTIRLNNKDTESRELLDKCFQELSDNEQPSIQWVKSLIQRKIGDLDYQEGKYEDAFTTIADVIDFRKRTFGEDHISVIDVYSLFSSINYELGHIEEATKYSKLNLAGQEKHFGATNERLAEPLFNQGVQFHARGMYEKSEEYILKGIQLLENLDVMHAKLGFFYGGLGILYGDKKQFEKSIDAFNRSREIYLTKFDENGLRIARINVYQAYFYFENNSHAEAKILIEKSYDNFMNNMPINFSGREEFEEMYQKLMIDEL